MSWTLLSQSNPVAAKEHLCAWCPERIAVGTKHASWAGVDGGDFYQTRMHDECLRASQDSEDSWSDELCSEGHGRGQTCQEAHG